MQEQNEFLEAAREAETIFGKKRLEAAALPARIEELETKKRGLGDAAAIREVMTEIDELQKEREIFDLVLRSHAVAIEEAYGAYYADRLRRNRAEVDQAREAHEAATAAMAQAQAVVEAATATLRKAEHDVRDAERELKTRQDRAANLRSGEIAVAA